MAHTAAIAAAVYRVSAAAVHESAPLPLGPTPKRPTVATTEGSGKLLKADSIAELFRSDIQRSIAASPIKPIKLVGILATGSLANKPSEVYAEFTRKQCEALGVELVLKKVGGDEGGEGQGAIEDAIIEANADNSVHGILVSYNVYIYAPDGLPFVEIRRPIDLNLRCCVGILPDFWRTARSLFATSIEFHPIPVVDLSI